VNVRLDLPDAVDELVERATERVLTRLAPAQPESEFLNAQRRPRSFDAAASASTTWCQMGPSSGTTRVERAREARGSRCPLVAPGGAIAHRDRRCAVTREHRMRGSTARVELNLEQLRASAHAVGWTLRHGRGNPAVHRRASHEARTLKKFDTSGRHRLRRLMTSSANDPATPFADAAPGRAGCRAVLPADRDPHEVVLPDRMPGRPADGRQPIGRDHDRHLHPIADGRPAGGRRRTGHGRRGGTHARAIRRARTTGHSRRRSATTGHAGHRQDQGELRALRQGIGNDLGTVP
jgi:hypothetical protein